MQRSPTYLNYRPSQIAAASVLCAINISISSITNSLKLTSVNEETLSDLISNTYSTTDHLKATSTHHPLRHWNTSIRKLTGISADKLIKPVYIDLIDILDTSVYNSKLQDDQTLFITE